MLRLCALCLGFLGIVGGGCAVRDALVEWTLKQRGAGNQEQKPSENSAENQNIARLIQENRAQAELLKEMIAVVLKENQPDAASYISYLNSLSQGASLEGIYNGLTHSAQYRTLEEQSGRPNAKAVARFAAEWLELQKEIPEKERQGLKASLARPLSRPIQPGSGKPMPAAEMETKNPSREAVVKTFLDASPFTLKRVLGDAALQCVSAKLRGPDGAQKLAEWYGAWAGRMASYSVDFGLELRNRSDAEFHLNWAKSASSDRVVWEVLNRLHRILNSP